MSATALLSTPAQAVTPVALPVGESVAPASPDFDGDGLADFAFGYYDGDQLDQVRVRYGSGTTGQLDRVAGRLLAANLNGDAYTDLVMAYSTGVDVAFGSASGLQFSAVHPSAAAPLDDSYTASAVALVSQPVPRLIVGVTRAYQHSPGKLVVYSLDSQGLPSNAPTILQPGKGGVPKLNEKGSFGYALASAGNQLFVGAPDAKISGRASAGAVAMLTFGTFGVTSGKLITQATKGVAGAPATRNQFGFSLAASDGYFAVGAIRDDVPGARDTGAVHLFRLAGSKVTPVKRISQSSAGVPGVSEPGDKFGSAVAIGRVCPGVTGLVVGASSEVLRKNADDWPEGSAWLIPLRASSTCRAVQLWEGKGFSGEPETGRLFGDLVATIRDAGATTDKVIVVGGGGYSDLSPDGVLGVWSPSTGQAVASEEGFIESVAGR